MGTPLNILFVEDEEDEVQLLVRALRKGGIDPVHQRVDTEQAMRAALDEKTWDALLVDYALPSFSVAGALELLKELGLDLPFIVVSGTIGEERAAEVMRAGAHDLILKDRTERLVPAIERELSEATVRHERERAEEALRKQEASVRLLQRIAVATNEAPDVETAMRFCLDELCAYTGWPVGHVYRIDEGEPDEVVPTTIWHLDNPERFETFRRVTEETRFGPGNGLPGRVLATREPAWVVDITKDPNFPRAKLAEDIGVKAGFAFPVLIGSNVGAILEFFSEQAVEPNEHFLSVVTQVGSHFARVIERKRAEEELRDREAQLRLVTNALPVLITYIDRDLRYRFNNKTYEDWYGYTLEELRGRKVEEVLGEEVYRVIEPRLKTALAGKTVSFEDVVPIRLHGPRHVLATYVPDIREDGEIKGLFALVTDITERKRVEQDLRASEEWLRAIMENAADGIVAIDESGRIETVNAAALGIFGYDADGVIGQNFTILMAEPDRSEHQGHIDGYLRTDKSEILGAGPRELLGRRKDGTTFPMEIAIGEMTIGDKRSFIGTIRDITERKTTEAQLRQAQRMEVVGQLTGGVAHDFNNILAAILGYAELLRDRPGIDNRSLQVIIRSTMRGAELTQRLLAFSRTQTLQPKVIDINKLVAGVTELMRRTFPETIEIDVVDDPDLWLCEVDSGQLENALLNLSLNARDALPGGGTLTIEAANIQFDDEYAAGPGDVLSGDYVKLSITDTGIGIAPEVVEHVFEPFFTTKDVGEGTGLGLSMVYGFIKQSGGHITFDSEPGHGTTVTLYLPKSEGAAQHAEQNAATKDPSGHGETVLVVEDDEYVRQLVTTILDSLGYKVLEARDGNEALAELQSSLRIDLLLTDVVLPGGMSGPDIVEKARRHHPGFKCLFMSGYSSRGRFHQGRLPEDAELLNKPFTKRELAEKVRAVLDRSAR